MDPTAPPAPPSVRDGWTPPPQTNPPMPFTDWPYGGTTALGDNRTASVDSPLMVAIANTDLGKLMKDAGIQVYGWVDYGGNISTSTTKYGNAPAAYDYNPNASSWTRPCSTSSARPTPCRPTISTGASGCRRIYGENYRYTTSYGLASYQLLKDNNFCGYDFPMVYGEIYIPQVAQGMMIRVGRYISVPDIEAQLAPNNYMYTPLDQLFVRQLYERRACRPRSRSPSSSCCSWASTRARSPPSGTSGRRWTNLFPNSPANLAQINKASCGHEPAT